MTEARRVNAYRALTMAVENYRAICDYIRLSGGITYDHDVPAVASRLAEKRVKDALREYVAAETDKS
jgi:hypothetical protein